MHGVFEEIASFQNLMQAEKDCAADKSYNWEVLAFRKNLEDNLFDIRDRMHALELPKVTYRSFLVYIPKVRRVIYTDYTTKVIQRAIYNVLYPRLCRNFIEDTYACIPGRGQIKAVQRLHSWFQIQTRSRDTWYYHKFDVQKFFYRIDHGILLGLLDQKVGDWRTVEMIKFYVCATEPFGMPLDGDHLTITREEMLWDVGITIGGGLSHMLGNLYLDPLDQFAKRTQRERKYIRYMDDLISVDSDKERLRERGFQKSEFLKDKLKLQFNQKTCLRPVRDGCEFVGCRVFPDHLILRKPTTLRMKHGLAHIAKEYHAHRIDFARANQTVQSYKALLKHVDSTRLEEKIWSDFVLTHNEGSGAI